MFNGPSPIAAPTSNNLTNNINTGYTNWNPQEMELMMRQKFNQNNIPQSQMQPMTNDPYTEFQNVMGNCPSNIRYKIMHDDEYIKCDTECEMLIKQAIEEVMIPQVISTPNGRIAFEKFLGVAKQLKEKYTKEEIETNQQLQKLMQDEVVQQRLKELSQQQNHQESKL